MIAPRVTLHLTSTTTRMYRGQRSPGPRQEINLPTYEVRLDGKEIGVVCRTMVTRETRSKGRRYVNSRWESPGWVVDGMSWCDRPSRREALEVLLGKHAKDMWDARALAAAAKVVKATKEAGADV